MKNIRIAGRYAKAFFELSVEMGILEEVRNDMILIAETFEQANDLRKVMLSPVIKDEKKVRIVHGVFSSHINKFTERFIDLVIVKNRFVYLDYIADEFLALYRIHKNIKKARFTTTHPLSVEHREKIIGILKEFTHMDVELTNNVQKDLLGGFVLKIDDMQYDASIKTKLLKIKKEFSVNIFEKGL